MGRIATWVRRPEDPKTPSGWIVWGDRQLPEAQRTVLVRAILVAFAAFVGMGLLGWWIAVLVGVPLTWVGLAIYARPGAREHADLPTLGGADAFPVTVDVRRRGQRVGRENGWVAFVDGWLVYEGLRTSFSFRASDATRVGSLGGYLLLRLPDGTSVRMFLLTDFMQTRRPGRRRDRRRLLNAYDAWRRRRESPEGEPILPPRETSPRIEGERIGERVVALALVALVGIFGAAYGPRTIPALAAPVALVLLFDIAVRVRALRERLALPPPARTRSLED